MKIKRQKKVNRYLNFYRNNYGVRQPYQILIDGTFCLAALENKINIKEQLPKYLEGEVKLLTTACVITETENLGPKLYGAMLIVKQFAYHKCGHEKSPGPASECLLSMIANNNPSHYFVATQDVDLRKKIRKATGTPLLYIAYNCPLLERPSQMSEKSAEKSLAARIAPKDYHHEVLKQLKKEAFGGSNPAVNHRKRKRPAGPNPLSCKKKKQKPNPPQKPAVETTKTKKRKKRKKKPTAQTSVSTQE